MVTRVINTSAREITVAPNQIVFAATAKILNSFGLSAGQLVGSSAAGVPQAVTLAGGTNISIDTTSVPGTYTINGAASTQPGLSYVPTTATTSTATASQIVLTNGTAVQTVNLPTTPVPGMVYGVEGGTNAAGWVLQAQSGQQIVEGDALSVAGGTIVNGDTQYDGVKVLALSTTLYKVIDSNGNPKMQIS